MATAKSILLLLASNAALAPVRGQQRASWTRPDAIVPVVPRSGAVMITNTTHLLAFNGLNVDGANLNPSERVWGFDQASNAWGQVNNLDPLNLAMSNGAVAVVSPTLSYVFGGMTVTGGNTGRLVSVTPAGITQVVTNGTGPASRRLSAAAYLPNCYGPNQACLVVHGGTTNTNFMADLYVLDFRASPPRWSAITPAGTVPVGRYGHSAVASADGTQAYFFGGLTSAGAVNDVFVLAPGGFPDPLDNEMTNIALLKNTTQSSTIGAYPGFSSRAVDGIRE